MEKKKGQRETYAIDDPTNTSAKEREDMAKEATKNSKQWDKPNFH